MPKPIDDTKMWDAYAKKTKTRDINHDNALVEGYKNGTVTKEQLIEEGLWDRMKARGAGVVGATKDIGGRIKGGVQGMAAGVAGTEGPAPRQFSSGLDAKAMSIINSHVYKIEKEILDTTRDLKRLGLDTTKLQATNPEVAQAISALTSQINSLKSRLAPTGQVGKAAVKVGDYKGGATAVERGKAASLVPFKSGFKTQQTVTPKGAITTP